MIEAFAFSCTGNYFPTFPAMGKCHVCLEQLSLTFFNFLLFFLLLC